MTAPNLRVMPTREERRRELERRTKGQLASVVRRSLVGSMHPPERWTKAELVGYVLDHEYPAPAAAAEPPAPDPHAACRLCGGGPHAGHAAFCREDRRYDLESYSKQQLVTLLARLVPADRRPADMSWRKDQLVRAVLDHEYPAPAGAVSSPAAAGADAAPARDETPDVCALPGCGEPMPRARTGRPGRYHSAACRQAAHRDRARQGAEERRRAAELDDARGIAAVVWPQIEPIADDITDLISVIVAYAACDNPDAPGTLEDKLAELHGLVGNLESLALLFRRADRKVAELTAAADDAAC